MAGIWQMGEESSSNVWDMGSEGAFSTSFSISSVGGDNVITSGETAIPIVGNELNTVTSAFIETTDSAYSVDVTASYSASDANNATFNHSLGDVPLSTSGYQLRLGLSDGVDTVYRNITVTPASGNQVVELAGTLILTDPESVFAPYTGPDPVIGEQYVVPTVSDQGGAIIANADSTFSIDYTGVSPVPSSDSFAVSWWSHDGSTGEVWSSGTVNVTEPSPVVESVTVPADGTYGPGDTLTFVVDWATIIDVTGTPQLTLTLGTETVLAPYVSGTGTDKLTFQASVPSVTSATGALSVDSLGLNGGSLKDTSGTDATLTLNNIESTAGITIDTTGPATVSVTVPTPGTYVEGDVLGFTVNWAEAIFRTGSPRLAISIGGTTKYATYDSKPGSAALHFVYTVQSGDTDNNGILILSLELNGGTIKDSLGNNAGTVLNGVGDTSNILVDAAGPQVDSVTLPANGTYGITDVLSFTVNFTSAVDVTGTPRLPIVIDGTTVYADYTSGTGTTALVFSHTLATADLEDTDGIALLDLELNGGTMQGSGGANAVLTIPDKGPFPAILVDTAAPTGTLTQTAVNTAQPALNGTVSDPAAVITVSPGSTLATNNGDGTWDLPAGQISPLSEGNNTVTVVFEDASGNSSQIQQIVSLDTTAPTVVIADQSFTTSTPTIVGTCDDPNALIELTINSVIYSTTNITGGNWSIPVTGSLSPAVYGASVNATDPAGNVGNDTANITITDTGTPTINSVTLPANGVYDIGETLTIVVNYSEPVTVTGTPFIPVAIGGNTRNFSYASGSGTSALSFTYAPVLGDNDDNGLGIGDIDLNGGTLKDASGNDAALTLGNPANSGIVIDTEAAIISVSAQETFNTAPIVSGTCDEATATLTLVVNGVTYNPIPLNDGTWSQQLEPTAVGSYTMTLDAVDVAGHVSTQSTATLTIKEEIIVSDPNEPDRLTSALQLLKRRLGRYTNNPTELDTYLMDELRATQQRLENEAVLPWFLKVRSGNFQTIAGGETISLPASWLRLRDEWDVPVQVKKGSDWYGINVYSYDQLWKHTTGTGFPKAAAIDGTDLVLGPTPDAVYQVKLAYYSRAQELSEGTITSNVWLKYAFELMVGETGLIIAQNYLKNKEAVALFDAMASRARRSLEQTNVAIEVAAMESWELNNGH